MKVLLVNNSGHPLPLFEEYFKTHDLVTVAYGEINTVEVSAFDCAVLSGSSDFPIVGNENRLSDELEFIRSSPIPILGICYGFELIIVAFGGTLKKLEHKEQGVNEMTITDSDPIFSGIEKLFVYEGHRWVADSIPDTLTLLAKSAHGTEAVKHKSRMIYGFQFHPEKLTRETAGGKILENFISLVAQ